MERISPDLTHDLRNVFAIIIGNCELAARAPTDHHISRIRAAADRATALLESDSSKAATMDFEQPVDLNAIAQEVNDMLRSTLLLSDKVRVTLDLALTKPKATGSALWMFLSVFNICLNARDAMTRRGGSLIIATRSSLGTAEISVADTGKGISAAELRTLWKRKVSPDQKHGHGLQIVQVTVARMKGKVEVETRVKAEGGHAAGSTFRIVFPERGSAA